MSPNSNLLPICLLLLVQDLKFPIFSDIVYKFLAFCVSRTSYACFHLFLSVIFFGPIGQNGSSPAASIPTSNLFIFVL